MHTSQLPSRRQEPIQTDEDDGDSSFEYEYDEAPNPRSASSYPGSWQVDRAWTQRMSAEQHAHAAYHSQGRYNDHPQPPPQPQMPSHRVYLLRCSLCDTFLSDRGMRAVLLLKPSITLFSTDAAPLHSGAHFTTDNTVERTCDCLTQSLACYGCGMIIGYHIVAPCANCTQSVTEHSKSANGHRYVFHYRAVSASERTYREGEPGVLNLPASNLRIALPGEAVLRPVSVNEPLAVRRPRSNTLCGETDAAAPAMVARQSRSHYRTLQHGDTLYWHQLVMGGERITPVDPDRLPFSMPACER